MLNTQQYFNGHHWGSKWKLRAGYRVPSLQRMCYVASVIIVECSTARFLCTMHVFKVRTSSSPPELPLCQISFLSHNPLTS